MPSHYSHTQSVRGGQTISRFAARARHEKALLEIAANTGKKPSRILRAWTADLQSRRDWAWALDRYFDELAATLARLVDVELERRAEYAAQLAALPRTRMQWTIATAAAMAPPPALEELISDMRSESLSRDIASTVESAPPCERKATLEKAASLLSQRAASCRSSVGTGSDDCRQHLAPKLGGFVTRIEALS